MNPERVRIARAKSGKTLQEVADHMGVTPAAVLRYEQGKAQPAGQNVHPLAEALGVGPGWLIDPRPVNISDDKVVTEGDERMIQLTVISVLTQLGFLGDDD